MKQGILTSKISFRLYNKNKTTEKSPLNKQLTYNVPQILTLAIQLLYLRTTFEYIYWHQTTATQQFLPIKVSREEDIITYRKGMLEVKRSKQKGTEYVPLVHGIQVAMKCLDLLQNACQLSSAQHASS